MVLARRRRGLLVGLLVAGLAFASGKPSWGSNGEGLKNAKPTKPGNEDLGGDILDFSSVSPKDCANYLCVSDSEKATSYIEAGCPGQFALYEADEEYQQERVEGSFMGLSAEGGYSSGGVSTGTLLSLAGASGVFAVGVGFVAGYKASPSFAYMRIPSLS